MCESSLIFRMLFVNISCFELIDIWSFELNYLHIQFLLIVKFTRPIFKVMNVGKWFPSNWIQKIENIETMRKNKEAPVDYEGCEKCADKHEIPEVFRFQTLIALVLSSQTKDSVTFKAMQRLKTYGLYPENIASSDIATLEKIIYPVGFWRKKATSVKKISEIIIQEYSGDIPSNVYDLMKLSGVGPKMAYICMNVAWKQCIGIGVDTHVHRISNRLELHKKPTKTPENSRVSLESWLPKQYWSSFNELIVGFGQTICLPVKPKCHLCLNRDICEFYKNNC